MHKRPTGLLIVGQPGVGKTSFVQKATIGTTGNTIATIGVDYSKYNQQVQMSDFTPAEEVPFNLYDMSGDAKYRNLLPMHLRAVEAIVVMYDITDVVNFDQVHAWLDEINAKCDPDQAMVIGLVGNKLDKKTETRVLHLMGQDVATAYGLSFFAEISSFTGEGIHKVFERVAKCVYKKRQLQPVTVDPDKIQEMLAGAKDDNKQRKRCC